MSSILKRDASARSPGMARKAMKEMVGPRQAVFNGMHNVAVRGKEAIYIADTWNHVVRAIDQETGIIRTIAGTGQAGFSGDGGPAKDATFQDIMCVSLDPSEEHLYLADIQNRRIRVIDLATGIVRTIAGNGTKGVPADVRKQSTARWWTLVPSRRTLRGECTSSNGAAMPFVWSSRTVRSARSSATGGLASPMVPAGRLN